MMLPRRLGRGAMEISSHASDGTAESCDEDAKSC
jgi:hypothetical protein